MIDLLKSEIFRIRRRPQSLLLLVIAAILVGLIYGGLTIGSFFANASDAADLKDGLTFTEIRDNGLSIGSLFGGIMLAIFASGIIGNEYSWNTVRPLLARAKSRASLITAKLTALFIYSVIFAVLLAALTAVMSLICSLIVGESWGFGGDMLLKVVWYTLGIIATNLPYLSLAFLAAMWSKSNAAGIGISLGVSFLEPALFGIIGQITDKLDGVEKGGLNYNTMHLLSDGLTDGSGWVSLAVLLAYTVIFVAITYRIFLRRDVTSG